MIRQLRRLAERTDGAAAIEFAMALPTLLLFILGMFQVGIILQAKAGMQHALGEAARYATIYPTPTDAQLQATITSKRFGLDNGAWSTPQIASDANAGTKTITVSYTQPLDFAFFTVNAQLSSSKVVYLSE